MLAESRWKTLMQFLGGISSFGVWKQHIITLSSSGHSIMPARRYWQVALIDAILILSTAATCFRANK